MKKIVLATAVVLLMVESYASESPTCSDDVVKELVLNISKKEVKRKLASDPTYNYWHQMVNMAGDRWTDGLNDAQIQWYEKKTKEIAAVDKINLKAIRTDGIDEGLKKVTCKAQLEFTNGYKHNINYTAQITSEEEVFVEVNGLLK